LTNSGSLTVVGTLTAANVVLKSGATLGGTGALSGNLSAPSGATLLLDPTGHITVAGNTTLGGTVSVVPSTGTIAAGTYCLLAYNGSLSGTPTFCYSVPTGSGQTATFSTATAGVITVTVSSAAPSVPAGLTAMAGDGQVLLTWNAAANATGYNVKRASVSGNSLIVIATNITGVSYTNTGLANGTLYYFAISATNPAGESGDSAQVSARPVSRVRPQLAMTSAGGVLQLAWPGDHTGWRLEAQTNTVASGLGTNWVTLSGSDTNSQVAFLIDSTSGSVFFRLVYP